MSKLSGVDNSPWFRSCGDDPSSSRKAADALLGRRVDGLLIAASQIDDPLARSLRDRGTPHVLVLRTDGISPSSVCDDELGGYLATRYLIDLGHENIGILAGPDFASTARGRLAGYIKAMSEAGLVPDDGWIANSGFGFEAGRKTCAELLESHPEVTAYFGVNDRLALGGIFAARTHGLRVPEDISFVGYNDTPLAVQQPTGLTSVRVPFDHVAAAALIFLESKLGPVHCQQGLAGQQHPLWCRVRLYSEGNRNSPQFGGPRRGKRLVTGSIIGL